VFIENASAIEPEVRRLATNIAKPLLVDVAVTVEGANATRMYPRTLPDLFAEDELRVSGRLRGSGTVKFKITGKLAGKPVEFTRTVEVGKTSRPWTAPLWAQSRIDHLLEEIALDGSKTEYQNEVLELALAYNFVTPYTAFLAVPESELGTMHDTVAQARQDKQRILDNNPDVADLSKPKAGRAHLMADRDKGEADADDDVARNTRKRVAAKDDSDEDGAPDPSPRPMDRTFSGASREESEMAPVQTTGSASHAHGCAGCAMTGGNGASSALLILGTLLMLRRRRRA
jgi:hypothetical protein